MLPVPKKYRLNLLIEQKVSQGEPKALILDQLCDRLQIKKDMLMKYRTCRRDDKLSLSGDQLVRLAEFFSCTIDHIINYEHEEANA